MRPSTLGRRATVRLAFEINIWNVINIQIVKLSEKKSYSLTEMVTKHHHRIHNNHSVFWYYIIWHVCAPVWFGKTKLFTHDEIHVGKRCETKYCMFVGFHVSIRRLCWLNVFQLQTNWNDVRPYISCGDICV